MKDYSATLAWFYEQLPMYQRQGGAAYRPGLEAMFALMDYLGQPQKYFPSIHIAGTNGKGSTSHMMASVLQEAGYRVGLYTSPHLLDFRERIKLNGQMMPKAAVVAFVQQHQAFFEANKCSFFEMTVAMAFAYFAAQKVDIAVIEVGLGGRLDATNIIHPLLSVITNIGLDHTEFLGTTLAEIAAEKAGIIKTEVPVVVGKKQKETTPVFTAMAIQKKAPLYFAETQGDIFESDLKGNYQIENIRTVAKAVEVLDLPKISKNILQNGLRHVVANTGLLGRWQQVSTHPRVVLDVVHNKEGFEWVIQQLKTENYASLHLVMGFVAGRDIRALFELLPVEAQYYLSTPKLPRAYHLKALKIHLDKVPHTLNYFESLNAAYEKANAKATPDDLILICGSNFTVAELLAFFQGVEE